MTAGIRSAAASTSKRCQPDKSGNPDVWVVGAFLKTAETSRIPATRNRSAAFTQANELRMRMQAKKARGVDPPHPPPAPPPFHSLCTPQLLDTLDEIGEIGPERFGATHFGIHGDVDTRREQLQSRLDALEARVRTALHAGDEEDARRYNDEIREEFSPFMGEDRVGAYFEMFSAAVDWAGVAFYLKRNP